MAASPAPGFFARHSSWQSWALLAGGVIVTALAGIYMEGRQRRTARIERLVAERTMALSRQVIKHRRLERALERSQETLTGRVAELDQRNREIQLLNEAGDVLQACLSLEEAYPVIALYIPRLLPSTSGALYMHDKTQDFLSVVAEWGAQSPAVAVFKPEDCWALRRGRAHIVAAAAEALRCGHASAEAGGSLCVPLAAMGESIGLFHVSGNGGATDAFALSVAEHIGLALANLKLRSDLRKLSIHDALTGLYNRRYMEEAYAIELRRAERKELPVGVVMLDIDHFKAFNDGHGHGAGDELLRSLGSLLRSHLRAGDIACRYGGEEFLLILPEASLEASRERAEDLRTRVKGISVRYQDQPLGPVSISLGVAAFPGSGRTGAEVLGAADGALYRAKREGRDRVVVAAAGDAVPADSGGNGEAR